MPSLRSKALKRALKLSRFLATPVTSANLAEKRRAFAKLEKYLPVSRRTTIEPVQTATFKAEWIIVPESRSDKVMLYFHGGGFVFNSTKMHRDMISRIARTGKIKVLSVDYSLAPENRFPKISAEALAAYRWLLDSFSPKNIVIAGDSAGGSLALSLLHLIRNKGLLKPAAAVVIAPATDGNMKTEAFDIPTTDFFVKPESLKFFIESYAPPGRTTPHPIASPLHGEFRDFPPLLVHADKNELLHRDSDRMVKKAREASIKVEFYETEGLWHVWHLFARYIPEARQAIRHIGEFIQNHTSDD